MAYKAIMPKLDLTMEEGQINKWLVDEGKEIKKGDPLFEVISEKAAIEVESPADGVILKILHPEGDTVPVNGIVCIIGKPDEDISSLLDADKQTAAKSESNMEITTAEAAEAVISPKAAESADKVKASPAARRLAKENKLDLAVIDGSGPDGRIIERDVSAYLSAMDKVKTTPLARRIAESEGIPLSKLAQGEHRRIYKEDVLKYIAENEPVKEPAMFRKLAGIRKISAERLTSTWQGVPQVTITVEADLTRSLAFIESLNGKLKESGLKISVTDILIKAMAASLKKNPNVNAYLDNGTIIYNRSINIGFAVALEEGLVVPVLKEVDKKGLEQIVLEKRELISMAKENKLKMSDMSNGSITLSDMGMYGIDIFTPIINAPESTILGVGQIKKRPVVVDDRLEIRPTMWLSLTFDHRLLDGAPAATFLATIHEFVEHPEMLVL